jgi:hypothetical protein
MPLVISSVSRSDTVIKIVVIKRYTVVVVERPN